MSEKTKLTKKQKAIIIPTSILGSLLSTVGIVLLLLRVGKFAIYPEYYSIREIVCTNYGLYENYVSQGTAITDDGKYVITSGYMSDKKDSRIYITEVENDKKHYCELSKGDGTTNTSHFGGVAVLGENIYIAGDDVVYIVPFADALANNKLTINNFFEVNNEASYIFADDQYLYVGEFYDGEQYKTNNHLTFNNIEYNAIVEKYDVNNFEAPVAVYAVRSKVQGFAMNEKGDVLLSTSFGLADSHLYLYNAENVIDTGLTYLNAPLFVVENHRKELTAPAMSEDLDFLNGKFYTNFESACNKYFFGKLVTNANKIVSIDFSKWETQDEEQTK